MARRAGTPVRSVHDHSWRGQVVALMPCTGGGTMAQVMWTNPVQTMGLAKPEDLEVVSWVTCSLSVTVT